MPAARPWALVESDGGISSAHCICMAGKGEVCSHVASMLFYLEAVVHLQQERSPTEDLVKWVLPTPVKDIPYLPLSKIDFSIGDKKESQEKPSAIPVKPTELDITNFMEKISLSASKPAILALNPQYSSRYEPVSVKAKELMIGKLYKPAYLGLGADILNVKCQNVELISTPEILDLIEKATIAQSKSNLWFEIRMGRITASKFKASCATNLDTPSISLLKSICYPLEKRFSTPATDWGTKNEKVALKIYAEIMKPSHIDFNIQETGICLNKTWLFMGASPDSKIECACCGKGVVEVKCPYTLKDKTILEKCETDTNFCLTMVGDKFTLKKTHQYYYQVQAQIFLCNVSYCDFVLYSPHEATFMERILPDDAFWVTNVEKAEQFFSRCVLPEMLGKKFTKKKK